MAGDGSSVHVLSTIDPSAGHTFLKPTKKIHETSHVQEFLSSMAYADIVTFLMQLNRSMFPSKSSDGHVQSWTLSSEVVQFSAPVRRLQHLLSKLEDLLEQTPLEDGEYRYANGAYQIWHDKVKEKAVELLTECLSPEILHTPSSDPDGVTAEAELMEYFMGSWGSRERMDYGTGHELSFLAFLLALWKLNLFPQNEPGVEERALVLGVIEPYLQLIRAVIKKYKLEPAGTHGVWGLDDHSFIPYIFGSAQLGPAITSSEKVPEVGSLPDAPDPDGVTKRNIVERERKVNMYFSAIGFIYDVKRGPFWEHSQMLFDISGIPTGWAKINKGMLKMYNVEVLGKFPVVQHFRFGSLLSWDRYPTPTNLQSCSTNPSGSETGPRQAPPVARPDPGAGTRAPWATASSGPQMYSGTAAPWATASTRVPVAPPSATRFPTAYLDSSRRPPGPMDSTRAPWASAQQAPPNESPETTTRAPWAK
ncbi:rotamase PTPA-1 [Aspergillus avenaceus]|uniref:Serine/threonine-protein phosphatase 2A activator n=1 Tax=Aspergillus avenaceus TaxID=36643 RepID=A0A5N6TLU8_ASPAV|nr:rotamase PTPA-1 [Aspergillus avenaceus]